MMARVWAMFDTSEDIPVMRACGMNDTAILIVLCYAVIDNDSCKVNVLNN